MKDKLFKIQKYVNLFLLKLKIKSSKKNKSFNNSLNFVFSHIIKFKYAYYLFCLNHQILFSLHGDSKLFSFITNLSFLGRYIKS